MNDEPNRRAPALPEPAALFFDAPMPPEVAKWLSEHPPTNLRALQPEPAAPTVVEPAGKLHQDGYFTWNRRDGHVLDKRLPCDFYLAPIAATPPRAALTDEQIDALDTHALYWMAPRQRDSVRAFARAVIAADRAAQ